MTEPSDVLPLDPKVFEALLQVLDSQWNLFRKFKKLSITSGYVQDAKVQEGLDRIAEAIYALAAPLVGNTGEQQTAYHFAQELDCLLTPRGWVRQYEGVEGELTVLVSYVWGEHPGGGVPWCPTAASVVWREGDDFGVLVTMAAYEGAPLWRHTLDQPSEIEPLLSQLERMKLPSSRFKSQKGSLLHSRRKPMGGVSRDPLTALAFASW